MNASARAVDAVLDALAAHGSAAQSWLVGEPFFSPPDVVVQALREAVGRGRYGYTDAAGLPALRRILADLHAHDAHALASENILVTHGAKAGMLVVLASVLQPGDEVILPRPCFPSYPEMVRTLGATAVTLPQEEGDFGGIVESLAARTGPKTRALLLSSPSNPTGAVLKAAEARALVAFCREHDLRFVCDETYHAFRWTEADDPPLRQWDAEGHTVVVVRSFSKSHALCGWRVGYVVAHPAWIRRFAVTQANLMNPPNTSAQEALCHLPEVPDDYGEQAREKVRGRLEVLQKGLASAGLPCRLPQGGFYLWIDLHSVLADSPATLSLEWCRRLAEGEGVGLWPGEDYQAPGWVRLSAVAEPAPGWPRPAEELVERLRRFQGAA